MLTLSARDRGDSSVDIAVNFKHQQGISQVEAKEHDGTAFIRVAIRGDKGLVTHIDAKELPGWKIDEFVTMISDKDLRRKSGQPLAGLSYDKGSDLWREILLMDRVNYKNGLRDLADEYSPFFNVKSSEEMRKKMENLSMVKQGSEAQLLRGDSKVRVTIFNQERIVISVPDNAMSR